MVIVPDERWEALALSLRARLPAIVDELSPENFAAAAGGQALGFLEGRMGEGEELLVWLPAGRALVAGWTTLEPREEVAGTATASREEGLLARVFASGMSERGEGAELEAGAWTNLQERRGRRLAWLAASPVHVFGKVAGVLARAEYGGGEGSIPAEEAALLGRLVEDRILRAALGWEEA